jgi:hypothetical protein
MQAQGALSHTPPSNWACYNKTGADAAAKSNIALGGGSLGAGASAVVLFMDDSDATNREVIGHRRWLLLPSAKTFGAGSTTDANAIFHNYGSPENPAAANPAWIPWPTAGFFPSKLLNRAWSISRAGANFSKASVSVTKNGAQLNGIKTQSVKDGYGVNSLVWYMPESVVAPAGSAVDSYVVNVSGVSGGAAASYSYTVKVYNIPQLTPGTLAVSGSWNVGQTLTLRGEGWEPGVTLDYQWFRGADKVSWAPIPGANQATYKLTAADEGKYIFFRLVGNKPGYVSAQTSFSYQDKVVGPSLSALKSFSKIGTPSLSGTAKVGGTVKVSAKGTWSPKPTSFGYRWYADSVEIAGATGSSLKLAAGQYGKQITVKLVGKKSGYNDTLSKPSKAKKTAAGSLGTKTPSISGTVKVGNTVTAKVSAWTPAPVALTYQWYRSGKAITGAAGRGYSYTITQSDYKKKLTVRVYGAKTGYKAVYKTSKAKTVAAGTLSPVSAPTLTGVYQVGQTLTAAIPTAWGPGEVKLKFQWYRSGKAIGNATGQSYKLAPADSKKSIKVKLTGTKTGYASKSLYSSAKTVQQGSLAAVHRPQIEGGSAVGQTLKVTGWAASPKVSLKYQWYRSSLPVPKATGSVYKLTAADIGVTISVRVTGSSSGYATAQWLLSLPGEVGG